MFQVVVGEYFVRFGGEGLVCEEEGFYYGLLLDGVVFQVRYIDVFGCGIVVLVKQFDLFFFVYVIGDFMVFFECIFCLKSFLICEIFVVVQCLEVMLFVGGLLVELMLLKVQWEQMLVFMGQYGMSEGEFVLCEVIVVEVCVFGVFCEVSQVLIVSGLQQIFDLVSKLFIDLGIEVLFEVLIYFVVLQVF